MARYLIRAVMAAFVLVAATGIASAEDDVARTRLLAERGVAAEQVNLGIMYEGERDYAEAARWFRKAADQGFPPGQAYLGSMYEFGLGVPKDYVQAYMWYNLSAAEIVDNGKIRDELEKVMTSAQVAQAQKLSREWRPTKP
jgi:TPR repeat protein